MGINEKPAEAFSAEKQRKMSAALQEAMNRLEANRRQHTEPIAVIGMACRFPGASDLGNYWHLLNTGNDAFVTVPEDRWDAKRLQADQPKTQGKITCNEGGFIDDIDSFDARFFEITQREARSLDPQQRLLLETAWQTLEHAGIQPNTLIGKQCSVFTGICSNDYLIRLNENNFESIDPYFATGNAHGAAAGRLSYFLQWQGPSIAVDTACSSSLVAVHLAMQSLRNMESEMALAMGVNVIVAPHLGIGLSQAGMLSPSGSSRAFAAGADGFVRGEGCGAVLLKRLSHAMRDGDRIFCVLRGSAVNQDGRSNGLTAPNGLAQQDVIRAALSRANLSPADIDYIEAHGTSTELGDPIEMGALAAVFAPRSKPLRIGSVKTNIGHLEGAAGIAGLIKTCLALHHQTLPAHLNFDRPSPHIQWPSGFEVNSKSQPWMRSDGHIRRAGISSFGFGGTNAHVIVEEAPAPTLTDSSIKINSQDSHKSYWLKVSAKTPEALSDLAIRYADALDDPTNLELANASLDAICFAANAGRSDFAIRAVVHFSNRNEMVARLRELTDLKKHNSPHLLRSTTYVATQNIDGDAWTRAMHGYVAGENVDWNALYQTNLLLPTETLRRTVSLPSYAFQRQRCWFKPKAVTQQDAIPLQKLYGKRLDIAGSSIVYETDLQQFAELADHRVRGESVFPTTGYLELAMSIGHELKSGNLQVENLKLDQALRWNAKQSMRVQVILQPHADNSTSNVGFDGQILSRQSDGWCKHASFVLRTVPSMQSDELPVIPLSALRHSIATHYAACEEAGLEYSQAFKSLKQLFTTTTSAMGVVAIDIADDELDAHESEEHSSRYLLHPALLDGCLQSVAALLPATSGLWLPVAVGSYQILDAAREQPDFDSQLHFVATRKSIDSHSTNSQDDHSLRAPEQCLINLNVYNASNLLLAVVENILIQRLGIPAGEASVLMVEESESEDSSLQENLPELLVYMRAKLAKIMDCDASEIAVEEPLVNMGLDSLMAYELLHDLEKTAGTKIPLERLLKGMTLRQLVEVGENGVSDSVIVTPSSVEWIEGAI